MLVLYQKEPPCHSVSCCRSSEQACVSTELEEAPPDSMANVGGMKSNLTCPIKLHVLLFCQWEVRAQSLCIQHPDFSLTHWRIPASAAVSHTSQEGSAPITVLFPHNFLQHPRFQMTSFSLSIIGTATLLLYSACYLNLPFFCRMVQQPID